MAGGGAAYIRLEKPDNAISQGLQYWGGIAAQQGAEFRARNEREQERKRKELADWESKYGYNYDDFQAKVTGFNTYDQIKMDYADKVSNMYVDLNRKAYDAMSKGDRISQRNYENQMLRLKGTFKQINEADKHIQKLHEEYVKRAQEGKISGVDADNWEAEFQSILKHNYEQIVDENGNPAIHGIKELQDGSFEDFSVPFSKIIDGSWRPYDKQQLAGKGGIIDNALMSLGKKTVDSRNGNIITTDQVWDDQIEKGAKEHINWLLGNDEIMADLYNQMTNGKSRKRTDFTDSEKQEVGDKLLTMIKAGYDETSKIKVDTSEANLKQRKKEHADKMALAREKLTREDKDKIDNGEIVFVTQDVTGYDFQTQKASPSRTYNQYGMNIPYKVGKSTKNNATVTGLSVDETGRMIMTGIEEAGKETIKGENGSITKPIYVNFEITDQKEIYGFLSKQFKLDRKEDIDIKLEQLRNQGSQEQEVDEYGFPIEN